VIALIVFSALNYLPTILILTSFISVLMVVTRSYRIRRWWCGSPRA
jgi:lipopolysaccharide export system permease protein